MEKYNKTINVLSGYTYTEKHIEMYKTYDGKIFDNENDALAHETHLNNITDIREAYNIIDCDEYFLGIHYENIQTCRLIKVDVIDDCFISDLQYLYPPLSKKTNLFNTLTKGWNFIIEINDPNGDYIIFFENVSDVIRRKENELNELKKYENIS